MSPISPVDLPKRSANISPYISAYTSPYISAHISPYISPYISAYISPYISRYLPPYPPIYLPIHLPIYPPISPQVAGRRILSQLSEAFGRMMLGAGFIHGDPHPGNIFVKEGAEVPRT